MRSRCKMAHRDVTGMATTDGEAGGSGAAAPGALQAFALEQARAGDPSLRWLLPSESSDVSDANGHLRAAERFFGALDQGARIRTVQDLVLADWSAGSGSGAADGASKEPHAQGKAEDLLTQAASAYIRNVHRLQGQEDATQLTDGLNDLKEFTQRLAAVRSAALRALAPRVWIGTELLALESGGAKDTAGASSGGDGATSPARASAFALPASICELVGAGDPRPDPTALCAAGEVVQVAGAKGSGRKTLVMNAVLRSLAARTGESALWVAVPSQSADTVRAGASTGAAEAERRAQDAQIGAATKAAFACDALLKPAADDNDAEDAVEHADADRAPKRRRLDVEEMEQLVRDHDPLERLKIETCTTVDAVLQTVDLLLTSAASAAAAAKGGGAGGEQEQERDQQPAEVADPWPITTVVVDQVQRLFNDEATLQLLPGMTKTTVQADLQRLCRHLVGLARECGLRVYIINSALQALPYNPLSSFGSTGNKPSLGASFSHMLDATLWVSRGANIFPHVPVEPAATESAPKTAYGAALSTAARLRVGADAAHEHELRRAAAGASTSRPFVSAAAADAMELEQRLAQSIAARGPRMRTHVLEVLESSRGGKGRWATYLSDGNSVDESPPLPAP